MKLHIASGRLTAAALFWPVVVSFLIGAALLGGGMLLAGFLLMPSADRDQLGIWMVVSFFPIALAFQALVVGALISLGVWIYNRFGTIEAVDDQPKL